METKTRANGTRKLNPLFSLFFAGLMAKLLNRGHDNLGELSGGYDPGNVQNRYAHRNTQSHRRKLEHRRTGR